MMFAAASLYSDHQAHATAAAAAVSRVLFAWPGIAVGAVASSLIVAIAGGLKQRPRPVWTGCRLSDSRQRSERAHDSVLAGMPERAEALHPNQSDLRADRGQSLGAAQLCLTLTK